MAIEKRGKAAFAKVCVERSCTTYCCGLRIFCRGFVFGSGVCCLERVTHEPLYSSSPQSNHEDPMTSTGGRWYHDLRLVHRLLLTRSHSNLDLPHGGGRKTVLVARCVVRACLGCAHTLGIGSASPCSRLTVSLRRPGWRSCCRNGELHNRAAMQSMRVVQKRFFFALSGKTWRTLPRRTLPPRVPASPLRVLVSSMALYTPKYMSRERVF